MLEDWLRGRKVNDDRWLILLILCIPFLIAIGLAVVAWLGNW